MINELVQRFKIHLEEGGKSTKTIESYVGVWICPGQSQNRLAIDERNWDILSCAHEKVQVLQG